MIKKCAWCGNALKDSDRKSIVTSSMNSKLLMFTDAVCSNCRSQLKEVPQDDVSHIPRDFIDNLPYGNILLDEQGYIKIYNQQESTLTGLEISKVEGKHFFKEIAPCTAVKEFEGEFDRLKINGYDEQVEFEFRFKHKNFQAQVHIVMTYFSTSKLFSFVIKKIHDL